MFKVGEEVLIRAKVLEVNPENLTYDCEIGIGGRRYGYEIPAECIVFTDKTYSDGLNDAWELAFKIAKMNMTEITKIFGCGYSAISSLFTAEEALAKIEAYEKEKEIKVGDVVKHTTESIEGVVTMVTDVDAYITWIDGSCGHRELEYLIKTGKHIDIESLLRQIGE